MEKKIKTIAVLQLVMALGLILFWVGFFTVGMAPENPPPCYFAYEHSFPVPDIIMAIALIALSLIHISEPTRLLSISYAVFCLKKKTIHTQ